MIKLSSKVVILILASFLIAAISNAEINGDESISWIVADSDVIILGRVMDVKTEKGRGEVVWEIATVAVTETLLGEHVDQRQFIVRHLGRNEVPSKWAKEKVEMLFCLVTSERYQSDDKGYMKSQYALRYSWGRPSAVRLNGKPVRNVYTIDLKVLTEKTEILKAIRNAISRLAEHGKPKAHELDVPLITEGGRNLYAGSAVYLIVPVDDNLESHAKTWLKSGDKELRYEAIKALKYFKTEGNISLLRSLLADETPWISGSGKERKRVYYIRKEAYSILNGWGINVEKPVIEER